jgi:hypothetical protein
MTNRDVFSHRLNWAGILAGLVVGLVVQLTLIALGTAITALTGITLTGVGIAALIWLAISVLVAAYAAGLVAVRASAPASVEGTSGIAAMTKDDATLAGLVTGSLLVLLGSLLGLSALRGATGTATSALGSLVGGTTAVAGAATAGAAQAAQTPEGQNIIGNFGQQDVADLIAQASPTLDTAQVNAAANVVGGIVRRAAGDLGDLGSVTQLSDFVTRRTDAVKKALTGDELVTRLERQGLSAPQATEVRTSITQAVDNAQKQLDATAAATERIARSAANTAGWGWLLAAGLTLLLAITGARNAASGGRTVTTDRTTVRR